MEIIENARRLKDFEENERLARLKRKERNIRRDRLKKEKENRIKNRNGTFCFSLSLSSSSNFTSWILSSEACSVNSNFASNQPTKIYRIS